MKRNLEGFYSSIDCLLLDDNINCSVNTLDKQVMKICYVTKNPVEHVEQK